MRYVLVFLAGAATAFLGVIAMGQAKPPAEVVKAKRFVVVNDAGEEIITLGTERFRGAPHPMTGLVVWSKVGDKRTATVAVGAGNSAGTLSLQDNSGRGRFLMAVPDPDDVATMIMYTPTGFPGRVIHSGK